MARYIDADKLEEALSKVLNDTDTDKSDEYVNGINQGIDGALLVVSMSPTEDVRPVARGKWINKSQKSGCGIMFVASECTACGKKANFNCDELLYNFCPNCGADMREVEE
jgi:hypothetical protein